jgi:hypothetical protein
MPIFSQESLSWVAANKFLVASGSKPKRSKGQNQLIFKQEMPDNIERIELIESLLKTLEA